MDDDEVKAAFGILRSIAQSLNACEKLLAKISWNAFWILLVISIPSLCMTLGIIAYMLGVRRG